MADGPIDVKALQQATAAALKMEGAFARITSSAEATAVVQTKVADEMERMHDQAHAMAKMSADQQSAYVGSLQEEVALEDSKLQKLVEGNTLTAAEIAARQEALDLRKEELGIAEDMLGISQATADAIARQAAAARGGADASADTAATVGQAEGSISNTLEMMTNVSEKWKHTGVGAFFVTAKAEGFGAALGKVADASKKLFSTANILGSGIMQIGVSLMKMVFALDGATASFNQSSGAGGRYNEMIGDSYAATLEMGGTAQDFTGSLSAMRNEYAGWVNMSKEAKQETALFGVAMNRLGVSFDTSAKFMENSAVILGKTGPESQQFAANLHALAGSLDMDFNKVMENMGQHMDTFAQYGQEAGTEFMRMQAIARKTGIEMSDLIALTEQYDTVTGSMMATAKLNAALGNRYLNASDMMNMSLSERVVAIKGAMDASGKSFAAMAPQEKRWMAQQMGIKNVTTATKLFGEMTAEQLQQVAKDAEAAGQSMEEFMAATEESKTVGGKFNAMLASLADLAMPIIEAIKGIADGLLLVKSSLGGGWLGTIGLMVTAFLGLRLVPKLLGFVSGQLGKIVEITTKKFPKATQKMRDMFGKKTTKAASEQGKSFAETIRSIGKAAGENVKGLLTLGATFIMIGIGIGIIVLSLAVLASQMKDMSGGQMLAFAVVILAIAAAIYIMIPAIFGLAPASAAAAVPMLLFGVAMLLVGAGVALAGVGLWLFAQAFLAVAGDIGTFAMFVGLMALLAVAAILLGVGGIMAVGGLMLMSIGLIALALALAFIDTEDLQALGQMMQGMGKLAEFSGKGMGEAVPGVKALMQGLLGMSTLVIAYDLPGAMRKLGMGFIVVGSGAGIAAETLPLMASPLFQIAEAMGKWAEAQAELMKTFPMFVLLMGGLALALLGIGFAWFGILAVVGLAAGLSAALSDIPEGKAETFTRMFETLEDAGPTMQKITPAVVDNVGDLVEQAHEYSAAVRLGGGIDSFAEMIKGALGGGTKSKKASTAGGGGIPQTVILEVDGTELARFTAKKLNERDRIRGKFKG